MKKNRLIDEIPENRKRIRIVRDADAEDPRRGFFDNVGKLVCFHRRYRLGDEFEKTSADFSSWDELMDYLVGKCGAYTILPVYMYDHSGITISTTPFSCPRDSGQIGFIYMTEGAARENWPGVTEAARVKSAMDCLKEEVGIYDAYLLGAVYGYIVEDFVLLTRKDGTAAGGTWEERESCWGFYGDDPCENGIMDAVSSYLDEGYIIEEEDC